MSAEIGNYEEARLLLEKARSRLDAAATLLRANFPDDSVSRSYYAAFAAISMIHTQSADYDASMNFDMASAENSLEAARQIVEEIQKYCTLHYPDLFN